MKNHPKYRPLALTAMLWLCGVFCLSGRAEIISAQFAVTYQNKLTAGEAAGAQPAANWNLIEANSGYSGNVVSLKDSSGTATTMSVAWTTDRNGFWPRGNTVSTPNAKLYGAVLTAGANGPVGGNATVTLSGVPYTTYTIYAYLASGQSNRSGKIKLNSGSLTNWNAQQFGSGTTFTEVTGSNPTGNYIKWTGVTGSSATITVQPNGGWVPVGITGIQIVEEPSVADVVSAHFAVSYQNKLDPAETAGAHPAANWNVVVANSGTAGTFASLKNSTGATTAMSLAWTTDRNGMWPRGGTAATSDEKVLGALLIGGHTGPSIVNATVTLGGIPYSSYTIYAYMASPQSNRSGWMQLNSGPKLLFNAQNFNASFPWAEVTSSNTSGNYVKWTGLTGSTQTIIMEPTGGWTPAGIGGIQIVADGTPPPVPTATSSSHQSGNEPAKAIDSNPATFWHSQWSPGLPLPQSITIDQGIAKTVACLRYLPRQDGGSGAANGNISSYNIYVSTDGASFTKVVNLGSWSVDSSLKTANFTPVTARYVRLEALAGHAGWANAAEITLLDTHWYKPNQVTVLSPAYTSNVSGNTTVTLLAPGMTTATVRCWQAGGTHGSDSVVATVSLTGANGNGSFVFPANSYPRGPITLRINASNAGGTVTDNCYLQLYNTGGTSWNEGVPASAPPAAAGLSLVFSDDFNTMPSISGTGAGATYAAHKPNGGDFSGILFSNPSGSGNPFSQVGTYLRIRADAAKNTTGLISSVRYDGTGFWTRAPAYFECRFIAQSAPGTWPAFWLMTFDNALNDEVPADEIDIVEAYGGEGPGTPNAPSGYRITSHHHNQSANPPGSAYRISKAVDMSTVGGGSGWMWTPHVYGCLVGLEDTIYYLDNVEIGRHKTAPLSKTDKIWFMADFAVGGTSGWSTDLSRYNYVADMYIDYVRVYAAP